ncbi:Site-specific recombinase XerD [Arachidicoccus rhizosphaerae]|uniref:Site-specific recombinase XerD n=1 Tax=Arachidicoccus rhizosphaerae TaxID=551991 RepID=A0A1H3YV66_9BACT|nr:site-specific integrase [Arachidicoccus rhizosphaerae]SEA15459.1 Site-specific recombinase XerD [Arachidicoccus rhizosphaerae]
MKSNQKLTLLLWQRKSKATANGYAPIYCRMSIDGKEEELATGSKAHLDEWDSATKKAKGFPDSKRTNLRLNQITTDLERHFTLLQLEYDEVTPLMLKNVYNGLPAMQKKGAPKPEIKETPTLLQVADMNINSLEKMVNKNLRSNETLKQWKATRKKIAAFIKEVYRDIHLRIDEIDYSFATKFYNYLTIDRNPILSEASAKKQIKNTKQILSFAETHNYIDKNPIQKFRCGGDDTDVPPLEFHEVKTLWEKNISIQRLAEVRDAFIFQCFTGFAFQDVYGLTGDNIIKVGLKGELWLSKERGKTGVSEIVPIMPIAAEIIDKYANHPCRVNDGLLLPINSNARYNGYLKELAAIAGINRDLNTHLARHTFADMMLNIFEFSLEEVSKMLGHKSIRTTQRYAKVRKHKISKTWSRVRNNVFTKSGKLRQEII